MASKWMIGILLMQNIGVMIACIAERNYLKALYWFGASCINTAILNMR